MTRLAFFSLIFALCIAAPLRAAVQIKSGEHVDFSRVVLYFDAPVDWELGRIDDGYLLRTSDGAQDYDLTALFDFMPRSRLLEAREEPIVFSVTCDCHADAFEYRPGILVLDFKDGPPLPNSPFEKGFSADELRLTAANNKSSLEAANAGAHSDGAAAADVLNGARVNATTTEQMTVPDLSSAGLPSVRGTALRENLAQALGRAMTQGLVDAPESDVSKLMNDWETAAQRASDQITFRTATDLLQQDISGETDGSAQSETCLDPEHFDIGAWGQTPMSVDFLGQERSALASGDEEPEQSAIIAAVRAHLFMGFGAEAVQILNSFPIEGPDAEILRAMARQIDEPGRLISPVLSSQVECDGSGALWGLLALDLTDPQPDVNVDAIYHTVSSLPLHLRQHLAPIVSERLRRLNYDDMATAVRVSVSRATPDQSAEMILEEARAMPTHAKAAELEAVSQGHFPVALEAQSGRLTNHQPMLDLSNPDNRREIEAQIHVAKGSAEARDLLRSYMAALADDGLFEEAFEYATYLSHSRKAEDLGVEGAYVHLVDRLVQSGSDGNFVLAVTDRGPQGHPYDLPAALASAIAARLEGLGFDGPAKAYWQAALAQGGPVASAATHGDPDHRVADSAAAHAHGTADHDAQGQHGAAPTDHPATETAASAPQSPMVAEYLAEHAPDHAAAPTPDHGPETAEANHDAVPGAAIPVSAPQAPTASAAQTVSVGRPEAAGRSPLTPAIVPETLTLAAQEKLLEESAAFRARAAALLASN